MRHHSLWAALVVTTVAIMGCQSSSEADATGGTAAFTGESSASPDVPRYTPADKPQEYGARVRIAFGDGPFQESEETGSHASPALTGGPVATPFALGLGYSGKPYFAYFGTTNAKTLAVGTYSCADGDARIIAPEWNDDGTAKAAHDAASCSVVIDQIEPGPSESYARVYGRFEAAAALPDGLPQNVKGAFLADFPIDP